MVRGAFGLVRLGCVPLMIASVAGSVHSQTAQEIEAWREKGIPLTAGRENAALQYYAAWSIGSQMFESENLQQLNLSDESWVPDHELAAWLSGNDGTLDMLQDASLLTRCDFGIAYERGVMALLPHLGTMRSSAKLLIADARRLRSQGDADGAAARVNAAFRIAQHTTQDRILISSMVTASIAKLAEREALVLLEQNMVSRDYAAEMVDALNSLLGDDPAGMHAAVAGERDFFGAWLKANYRGPDAVDGLRELLVESSGNNESMIDPILDQLRDGTLDIAYAQMDRAYNDMLSAAGSDDPEQALIRFERDVQMERYGPLATLFTPAISNAFARVDDVVVDLTALKDRLLLLIG